MKPAYYIQPIINVAFLILLIVFLVDRCGPVKIPPAGEDPRDLKIDSLQNRSDDLADSLEDLRASYRDSSAIWSAQIDSYQANPLVKRIQVFIDRFGPPDTNFIILGIDSAQLDSCNRLALKYDTATAKIRGLTSELYLVAADLKSCNLRDQIRAEQLEDCNKARDLITKLYNTPRWRLVARCRLKRKLSKYGNQ